MEVAPARARPDVLLALRDGFGILRLAIDPVTGVTRAGRLLGFCSLLPVATLGIAWREGTLHLRQVGGRGLLEHLGTWAQFLACPVLVILVVEVLRSVAGVFADRRFISSGGDPDALFQAFLVRRCVCRTRQGRLRFGLFSFTGVLAVVVNLQNTRIPYKVYGQDVWDSSAHLGGYWIGKAFLLFEWAYLFPVVAFVALAVGTSIYEIVQRATLGGQELSVFSADGCGGFRPLGQTMIRIVYLDVPIAVIILALHYTHAYFYATLVLGACVLMLVVIIQLFLPFVELHRMLERLKEEKLASLEQVIVRSNRALDPDGFATDKSSLTPFVTVLAADAVYRQTRRVSTWPYGRLDFVKALAPFVPFLTTAVKLIF